MTSLTEQVERKLLKLEAEAQDVHQFWLHHHIYLKPDTPEHIKLEFLHPDRVFKNETPYNTTNVKRAVKTVCFTTQPSTSIPATAADIARKNPARL